VAPSFAILYQLADSLLAYMEHLPDFLQANFRVRDMVFPDRLVSCRFGVRFVFHNALILARINILYKALFNTFYSSFHQFPCDGVNSQSGNGQSKQVGTPIFFTLGQLAPV
jgi:hypothetical protein